MPPVIYCMGASPGFDPTKIMLPPGGNALRGVPLDDGVPLAVGTKLLAYMSAVVKVVLLAETS